MDKKIGNIICIFFFVVSTLRAHDQSIHLYILDTQQNPIRQAEKGVPFVLQIVVNNIDGVIKPDYVPGFDQFAVTDHGSNQSTTIINGQKSQRVIFNYILKTDTLGSFKVGPVEIKDRHGKLFSSEKLLISVGDQVVMQENKKQPYFLQVTFDKNKLFIGQDLLIKVRFYYLGEFQNLRIVKPDMEGFVVNAISDTALYGKEIIANQEYRYQEWQLNAYPEKTGTIMIPSFQALFMTPTNFTQGLFGIFDMFSMNSEKIVRSAAHAVTVLSLPNSQEYHDVTAVGEFDSAIFLLQNQYGTVGEGIVARMTIVGKGNMQMIKAPELMLPDGLHYYESNSSIKRIDNQKHEKIFEYILQADRAAVFKIPSQLFVYYDSNANKYKTLHTQEAKINIQEALHVVKSDMIISNEQKNDEKKDIYTFKEGQIQTIQKFGFNSYVHENFLDRLMNWLLLLFGCFSLLLFLYWIYCSYVDIHVMDFYWVYYAVVRFKVIKIIKSKDVHALYQLLYEISKRYEFDLLGDGIVNYFKKSKKSEKYVKEWHDFLHTLTYLVFSSEKKQQKAIDYVMAYAFFWTKEILSYCRVSKTVSNITT